MSKLRQLILLLIEANPLPPRYKDHSLSGDWEHHRDCHIEPDWLLLYKIDTRSSPRIMETNDEGK